MTETKNLQSLGRAAGVFQKDPRVIKTAIAAVQAERAYTAGEKIPREAVAEFILNGVPYFLANDVIDAITWLAKNEAKKAADQ
jgi:hypothetical protein